MSQPEPKTRRYDLTPGVWTEIGDTWQGKARAMPAGSPGQPTATYAEVYESGMVGGDGPITVHYYEA